MENIALIGIDLGKNSFHIHCQDRRGKAVYRKKFTRPKLIEFLATCPATTIAMEACGGSHFMARKLEELGHLPLRRQQGWYLDSTAREVGRHCWELVSEATKRSELCWFNMPGYSYKNWSTSLVNWPIGSEIYCAGKATLWSLVLWQTSWPE